MDMLEPNFFNIISEQWQFGLLAVLLALSLDFMFGEPAWLYARFRHPIVWVGVLISSLETLLWPLGKSPWMQIVFGGILVVITLTVCVLAGSLVVWFGTAIGLGWIVTGVVGSAFIASRSLYDHVKAVGDGIGHNLDEGRRAVSHIVGRDPGLLDEAAVARASLESLAENFSDGVVAPIFWFVIGGLPGLLGYKAINTLDSMIGHRNEKYLYFGRVAARLDDVVNWPAARLTGILISVSALIMPGTNFPDALQAIWRDAGNHNSPNAGWPEAALAGALGLALAGPRAYAGTTM